MRSSRFWTVVLLLTVTLASCLCTAETQTAFHPALPLSQMPTVIDGMVAQDQPLDDEVLSVLGR